MAHPTPPTGAVLTTLTLGAWLLSFVVVFSEPASAQLQWIEQRKNATQDAYVKQSFATATFNTGPLKVGRDDFGGIQALLQFDVSNVPEDSAFRDPRLLLYKSAYSGPTEPPRHAVRRLDSSWSEANVTWNTMPAHVGHINTYDSTAAVGSDDIISFQGALMSWVNVGLPNHGLVIEQDVGPSVYEVSYRDRAQELPPLLLFDYLPPPKWINVTTGGSAPTVDGDCAAEEYADAVEVPWISTFQEVFFLLRVGDDLFVCSDFYQTSNLDFSLQVGPAPTIRIVPVSTEWRIVLFVDANSSTAHTERGAGLAGPWETASLSGWDAAGEFEPNPLGGQAQVEFKFPLDEIGADDGPFIVSLTKEPLPSGARRGWPKRDSENNPAAWATVFSPIFSDGFESGNTAAWE